MQRSNVRNGIISGSLPAPSEYNLETSRSPTLVPNPGCSSSLSEIHFTLRSQAPDGSISVYLLSDRDRYLYEVKAELSGLELWKTNGDGSRMLRLAKAVNVNNKITLTEVLLTEELFRSLV